MTVAGWRSGKLGDLLEIKHGYALRGEYFAAGGTHIVLTPGNFLEQGGFKDKADKEKWYCGPVPRDFVLNEGDVIVAMTEQAEGLLGSSAIIPRSGLYLHNQRLGLVQVRDHSAVDKRFLYYLFHSRPVRAQIRATATGTKVRHTAPSRIAEVKVDIPPLAVQRRIAGILSAYDELIDNDLRRIRILEEMARALYREWFVDFRFPGHENVPFAATPTGAVPQGWEGRLGNLLVIERVGINPYQFPREEFEHFSIPAFDEGKIPRVEAGETILSSKYAVDASCVLLSKLNPHIPRVWLPIPDEQRRSIASTEFLVLKPQAGVSREFVYEMCCSGDFAAQFGTLAIGTSTSHQRVKPNDLLRMPVTTPDELTIRRFSSLIRPMLELSQRLRSQSANLRHTRDLLLPRLLSGQLSVDEAA